MNNAIERLISQVYKKIYDKVFTRSNLNKLTKNDISSIEKSLIDLEKSKSYYNFSMKVAKLISQKGMRGRKGAWRKVYESAKKNHHIGLPKTWSAFEAKIMSDAVKQNFKMISSIPVRMKEILHHKYTSTLIEEVAKGSIPRGSFRNMLAKHGHKQATLIARTETAKLQTAIARNRATSLGSVVYEWFSSRDKRTRQSHRMMNGVIVFWRQESEKPKLDGLQGDAGEYPNCRCSAEPIVDIDELTMSHYKVYDYRSHKVITMTKKDLIEAIQNGKL